MSAAGPLGDRLASRTLDLIDVPSVSGEEAAILAVIRSALSPGWEVVDDADAVLFAAPETRRPDVPFVVLAGHVDTVPIAGNVPGRRTAEVIEGRGAADMKGSLAVMLELHASLSERSSDLDVGLLFFGREELPITRSALRPLFERCDLARSIDLAVVMEPTDNAIEVGCLGNLNAVVTAHGEAAHSARPWLGTNAVHAAISALAPLAELPVRDVQIEGLVFREVMSVTMIHGGVAANVVPDRVEATVNLRYAPTLTPTQAEDRLRELLDPHPVELSIVGNAPPGKVVIGNPLVPRLREAGGLRVGPKQAWTPVAEFAMAGIDAVNLGPGDPQYAHRDDERVEVAALVRSFDVLRAFLDHAVAEEVS